MSCNRFLIDGALCKMWRICKSNQRFQTLSFSPSTLIVFENLHFQWRFQRFTVDGRRKRIEKYVFSNENALVGTGLRRFGGRWCDLHWRRQGVRQIRQIEHSSLWQCISHHYLARLALASVLVPFGVYLLTFQSTRCIDALIGVTGISGYLCPRIAISENTWSFD